MFVPYKTSILRKRKLLIYYFCIRSVKRYFVCHFIIEENGIVLRTISISFYLERHPYLLSLCDVKRIFRYIVFNIIIFDDLVYLSWALNGLTARYVFQFIRKQLFFILKSKHFYYKKEILLLCINLIFLLVM